MSHARVLALAALVLALIAPGPVGAQSEQGDAGVGPIAYLTGADRFVDYVRGYRAPGHLVVLDPPSGQEFVLAEDAAGALWSPDGQRLAYLTDDGLWTVEAAEGAQPQLWDATVEGFFAWHPNGRSVVAQSPDGIRAVRVDGTADADVSPAVQMTRPPDGAVDSTPSWGPDGRHLVYRRTVQGQGSSLEVIPVSIDLAPGQARVLMDRSTWAPTGDIAWTPDGRTVLLVAAPRATGSSLPSGIVAVDVNGGPVRQVAADSTATHPAVSPDGTEVAYRRECHGDPFSCTADGLARGPGSGIWATHLATGEERRIAETPGEERTPQWTADGRHIVFEGFNHDSGCHCQPATIWTAPADASSPQVAVAGVEADVRQFLNGRLDPVPAPGATLRVSGPTRVETAVEVSRRAFDRAPAVLLARADGYADALAAAGLAGSLGAPVLLTPTAGLPSTVANEIVRLGADRVVVLGDRSAISATVAEQLQALDVEVERLAGTTRYGTAAVVAAQVDADHAYIVQGAAADPARGWPDAVAVSGLAAQTRQPILLVERDRLPSETAQAIRDRNIRSVTIIGGPPAVSVEVEAEIADLGVAIERVAGANRYETSARVAEQAVELGADPDQVWVAIGTFWADSLTAGPAAAAAGGSLLLVDGQDLGASPATATVLAAAAGPAVTLVGGPDVLAPSVGVAIERHAAP